MVFCVNYWAYVLRSPAGRFYIGHTEDRERGLSGHNRVDKIAGKFTRKNWPWIQVWSEQEADRASTMRREREIKAWKSARLIRMRLLGLEE
jgi:putative endonuclease